MNALFSAAVAHAVTKACSSNRLSSCSCQRNTNTDTNTNYRNDDADDGTTDNGFRWDRCSDNVEFGVNFAKQFIDSVELNWSVERMYTSYSKSLMNLHNNEVGRKARLLSLCYKIMSTLLTYVFHFKFIFSPPLLRVNDCSWFPRSRTPLFYNKYEGFPGNNKLSFIFHSQVVRESMRHRCGCHGVSGSCATRICSQELLAFRFIGAALRRKYEAAVQVKMKYISTHHLLVPYKKETSSLTHIELVYLQQSPSYCNLVSGRRCKNKKASKGSCAVMCCGRGHRIKERTFLKNCRCKFIWCCKVTCQKCIHKQKIFTCK